MLGKTSNISNLFRPYREQINQENSDSNPFQGQLSSREYRGTFLPSYSKMTFDKDPFSKNQMYGQESEVNLHPHSRREYLDFRDTIKPKVKKDKRSANMHESIWQNLYARGLEARNEIMQLHQQKKERINVECTFQPIVRKNSRYVIPSSSNFLERNRVWHEHKIEKIIKEKEQEVTKNLGDCTFHPKLNDYYKPNCKRQPLMEAHRHFKTSKSLNRLEKSPRDLELTPSRRTLKNEQFGKIKHLIRKQLKKIQF